MSIRTVSKTINLGIPVEKVSKYITAIDQNGIKVHAENQNNQNYIQITNGGMTVYQSGAPVANFGTNAVIGETNKQHISITNSQIKFWSGTEEINDNLIAYIDEQKLFIPRVVVVQSMQAGNWMWDATIENHLSLVWRG